MVPEVIKLFEGDFAKMASMLQAQNDRVVLMNPKIVLAAEPEENPLTMQDEEQRGSKTD